MKVLVGCEESQTVTKAFRDRGHAAFSCDILPTRGNPDWHFQGDVMNYIELERDRWDIIILHPPCTALSLSGNRWYGYGMPRHDERIKAIDWTVKLWEHAIDYCEMVCLENPTSVIWQYIKKPQYIQPWQFGHGETKKTGLALHGLPELYPTNIVDGRDQRIWKMSPGPNRKRDRSVTYQGIADAMAEQWGSLSPYLRRTSRR
jgi:hypothetical protein